MASRMASLALALLLAIAGTSESALAQEFTASATVKPASQGEGGAEQQPDSSSQTPDAKPGATQTAEPSAKTIGSDSPVATTGERQKNTKKPVRTAVGKSPIQNVAEQILENLDSAVGFAQKSGSLGSASPDKQLGDIIARRDELRQKASVAKNDAAWTSVATEAGTTLADTLKLMASLSSAASVGQTGGRQSTVNHAVTPEPDVRDPPLRSANLPLYVATLSLVISLIALGGGWLLARHEINKVLTEAGLL